MQLVLNTRGLALKVRNRSFWVVTKEENRQIGPEQISSILFTAEATLSTAAIRLAVLHKIPIYLLDPHGDADACLWSASFVGLAELRRAQARWTDEPEAWRPWAIELAMLKTSRQQRHVRQMDDAQKDGDVKDDPYSITKEQLSVLDEATLKQQLLGMEGSAAREYWRALSGLLPAAWQFENRSRRPALDPFNAALNYLYGMLYPVVEQALFAAGLDPHMGVLHADEYDRATLSFDLIEPFRPWVDALLVRLCVEGILKPSHFEPKDEGWWVGPAGKLILIPAYNDWLMSELTDEAGEKRNIRNHIYAFAGALARLIREWHEAEKGKP